MKMNIYLTPEGMESYVKGYVMYNWHYSTRPAVEAPPKNSILIGSCEITMPLIEACVAPALAKLTEREAEINAQAQEDLQAIRVRKSDLLMLGCPVPEAKGAEL